MKKAIQKVRLMLEEQPKLVRMADCLGYSWSVVDEYTTDDSTKDSNHKDRLYIERVERAAKHHKKQNHPEAVKL